MREHVPTRFEKVCFRIATALIVFTVSYAVLTSFGLPVPKQRNTIAYWIFGTVFVLAILPGVVLYGKDLIAFFRQPRAKIWEGLKWAVLSTAILAALLEVLGLINGYQFFSVR